MYGGVVGDGGSFKTITVNFIGLFYWPRKTRAGRTLPGIRLRFVVSFRRNRTFSRRHFAVNLRRSFHKSLTAFAQLEPILWTCQRVDCVVQVHGDGGGPEIQWTVRWCWMEPTIMTGTMGISSVGDPDKRRPEIHRRGRSRVRFFWKTMRRVPHDGVGVSRQCV